MRPVLVVLLAAIGLVAHHAASADVFRCKSPAGKVLYTDAPCPDGMQTTDVTSAVQVCGSADCLVRRERQYRDAEARRRAEREELAALMEERHRRAREEAWLEALQPRIVTVPVPVAAPEYFYPGYAVAAPPLRTHHRVRHATPAGKPRWKCVDERCAAGGRPEPTRPGTRGRI